MSKKIILPFVLCLFLCGCIQSTEQYYSQKPKDTGKYVSVEINSDTAKGKTDCLPSFKGEIPFENGDSALTALQKVCRQNKIQLEYTGGYIEGIGYLYEFTCGDLSGWMYSVNGTFPGEASANYKLKEKDKVKFIYTCDLGKDVGNDFKEE